MTESEFYQINRKGNRNLVLLDDLVIDVTSYASRHPGGRFILDRARGTDISKYFNGAYAIDPSHNGVRNTHSNYARLICNKLVIAKLDRDFQMSLVRIISDVNATTDGKIKTFKFEALPG